MSILPPFYLAHRAPDRQLSPWFAEYWSLLVREGAPSLHALPPDGSTSILMQIGGHRRPALHVTGPWPEPRTIAVRPGEQYFGIRLQPAATWEVLGVEAATILRRTIPCDRYLGAFSHRIARQLSECESLDFAAKVFDTSFLRIADRMALPDQLVTEAVALIEAAPARAAISSVAKDLHTSYNSLLRRFKDAAGLTPSEFLQISRARRSTGALGHDARPPVTGTPRVESAPSMTGEVGLRLVRGAESRKS
jgi:AraC-like DNA-binding protein